MLVSGDANFANKKHSTRHFILTGVPPLPLYIITKTLIGNCL